ncbi:DUF420 domain-containing protein [Gangjinia marincola]|uniref:DUF420 domain-containing protein n=1 Tax=Gangjinia marincola TaxID=578463 RepID=A0ABP3XSY9_9FLAO
MSSISIEREKTVKKWIIALSVIIPIAVAALFRLRLPGVEPLTFLPPIYAGINGLTAIFLVVAVLQIKKGNRKNHERLIKSSMVLSVLFLLMYVSYHATADPTVFGDANHDGVLSATEAEAINEIKFLYYAILISHIVLSVVVIPFVLFTYLRAWAGRFEQHKKIARITFPLWLYVAVTGVIVYLMISPYYV